MITTLITLSISLLIMIICSIILINKLIEVKIKLESVLLENKKMKQNAEMISNRGVIKNQSLSYHSGNHKEKSLIVDYEVDILEITDKQFKVKATSFVCDTPEYDSTMHTEIINFMNGKWVNKAQVNLIMDDATKRNLKLEKLLG